MTFEVLEKNDVDEFNKYSVNPENNTTYTKEFYESIESNLSRFLREIQNRYNISIVLVDSNNNYYSNYSVTFPSEAKLDSSMAYLFNPFSIEKSSIFNSISIF